MTLYERSGYLLGYVVGMFTFLISLIRQARMFHPRGHLFEAEVTSLDFAPYAIIRLSSAWWKKKEWRDVLGVAIRFTPARPAGIRAESRDQDMLFASFSRWWMTPIGPLLTEYHDFFRNHYYTVAPFHHQGQTKTYKLVPKINTMIKGSREEKLIEAVLEGEAVFILQERILHETTWTNVAAIKLTRPLHYDQEALKFNPFQNGVGVHPAGFLQHLRIGAYHLSQLARPTSDTD